jgi:glycosyltransferase involved in cell wall biosynthesis
LGLPVVVSQVGVNASIVQEGLNGFLCEEAPFVHHVKWVNALSQLLENSDLRDQLGVSGRKHIQEHYSVKAQKKHYADPILAN